MHTGRTIEELIELVQRINTHAGIRPRSTHERNVSQASGNIPALSFRQEETANEPAWLAVFR